MKDINIEIRYQCDVCGDHGICRNATAITSFANAKGFFAPFKEGDLDVCDDCRAHRENAAAGGKDEKEIYAA